MPEADSADGAPDGAPAGSGEESASAAVPSAAGSDAVPAAPDVPLVVGRVSEIFGAVTCPNYMVRASSEEALRSLGLRAGMVLYAVLDQATYLSTQEILRNNVRDAPFSSCEPCRSPNASPDRSPYPRTLHKSACMARAQGLGSEERASDAAALSCHLHALRVNRAGTRLG